LPLEVTVAYILLLVVVEVDEEEANFNLFLGGADGGDCMTAKARNASATRWECE